jgi:hypothetical protein
MSTCEHDLIRDSNNDRRAGVMETIETTAYQMSNEQWRQQLEEWKQGIAENGGPEEWRDVFIKRLIPETAHHEAGHAVVGIALGLDVSLVSVTGIDKILTWEFDHWGICRHDGDGEFTDLEDAIKSCAGIWAEIKFASAYDTKTIERLGSWFEDNPEFDWAADTAEFYGIPYERFSKTARKLVDALYPAIEHLARLLLERETIAGDELRNIVRDRLSEMDPKWQDRVNKMMAPLRKLAA